MRYRLLLLTALLLAGCVAGYRGPGTYPGYVQPAESANPFWYLPPPVHYLPPHYLYQAPW